MADEPQTKAQMIENLTKESLARGFIEFPKMLYHPDGRQLTVTSRTDEQNALNSDFCPTPQAALDVKTKRDEDDRQRQALAVAQEANAKLLTDAGGAADGKSK